MSRKLLDKSKKCKFCGMPVKGHAMQGSVIVFQCGSREVNDSTRKSLGIRPEACKKIEELSSNQLNLDFSQRPKKK